uniref:Uncharacterized protein n=1 Tax=Leersia perrieri TaxID=77586 RepID=A0A0D9VDT9_9ORYZ
MVRQPHRRPRGNNLQQQNPQRVDVRFGGEHPRLLVLGIDVAECPRRRRHPVLRGVGGGGGGLGDEAGEADVADLADKVVVEEDVGWFQIAVDEGLGFGLVEEEEARGDVGGDAEADVPWDWEAKHLYLHKKKRIHGGGRRPTILLWPDMNKLKNAASGEEFVHRPFGRLLAVLVPVDGDHGGAVPRRLVLAAAAAVCRRRRGGEGRQGCNGRLL